MSEASATLAGALAMLSHARRSRKRQRALLKDRTLQVLVADMIAARTAAGMTQHEVAMRMWTSKSAVSRLESGRYARPTLETIEKYALAVGAVSKSGSAPGSQGERDLPVECAIVAPAFGPLERRAIDPWNPKTTLVAACPGSARSDPNS